MICLSGKTVKQILTAIITVLYDLICLFNLLLLHFTIFIHYNFYNFSIWTDSVPAAALYIIFKIYIKLYLWLIQTLYETPLTSEDDQAEAPLRVPQGAPPQQHLVVVQGVGLSAQGHGAFELVQTVVGRLTANLT